MIDRNTVFLGSGGARGITAQCVIKLAQLYQNKFILVGRSEVSQDEPAWAADCVDEISLKKRAMEVLQAGNERPTPARVQQLTCHIMARREVLATLAAIRQAGGQAEYVSADITNFQALQPRLGAAVQRLGPVSGIIHGAGALADKPIERKSAADFDRVYGVKVTGLQNLLACVPLNQLNYLLLFSSAAGFYGNVGQTDYALANDILNKIAYKIKRIQPSCRVLSFNWGPWDGGMVTPQLRRHFEQHHIEVIPVESGTQLLAEKLQADSSDEVQLVVGCSLAPPPIGVADTPLQTYRIRRELSAEANPFLQDHIIGQQAVLPTVCGVAWVANVAEQLYPGYHFFGVENFKVLKGIVFADSLAHDYILDLKKISQSEAEIVLEAMIWSKNHAGPVRYHYKTQLALCRRLPEPPHDAVDNIPAQQATVYTAAELYQSGVLFHGPTFQGVQRVLDISPKRLILEGRLPRISLRQQGQFPVQSYNPFIADAQFQSLVIWARHFYQAGSLPLSCQLGQQFKPIQFDETFHVVLEVQTSTDTHLVANLTIYNQQGQICSRLTGAEVTISRRLNSLFQLQKA